MENKSEKQSKSSSLQDYLSLGYLFLLSLGMVKDIIYYGFLEINIISYSSVLDVLLSPFAELGENPFLILILLVFAFGFYKWTKHKAKKIKEEEIEKGVKAEAQSTFNTFDAFLFFMVLLLFSFFIGNGLGGGYKTRKNMKAGSYNATHRLVFSDGEKLSVKLVGNNSQYVFYLLEKGTQVSIAPISGNIKKIEKLPKKK